MKRPVAVKLIKAGHDTAAVLARFEAERQALAMMDHPNIARVFDAGTWEVAGDLWPLASTAPISASAPATGHRPLATVPYFVMELVKGVPITEFCDKRKLTPRQRLELFVPVCQAIQHAHQKGIIHRDIKPSNVLVALFDDRPVPKVIDFGVAKAAGSPLTDRTLMTGFGAVVGTPEYMSPEQASFNQLDVDTRSNVYALGVLLYELLTGSPPHPRKELEKAGLLEILRVIREIEPPRPSTRLSTAAAKASLAAVRGTEPKALAKLLRSELDWIVMKALEKDRARRYDTANGFAADVQRYLCDEIVEARPPSGGYRLKKFVKRHRGRVLAAGLVLAALIAGMAGTAWGLFEARREAERVRQEQTKTQDALAQAERNRDQAEVNLVHSYLRPLGFNLTGLDQAELIALDELARQEDDRLKLLFLREALADGERALRVARRAERVVQAAVGPSVKRRTAALELTAAVQRNMSLDPRCRLAACWLAIELGGEDLPALSESFDTLLAWKVADSAAFIEIAPRLVHPSNVAIAARGLVTVLDKSEDPEALKLASYRMAALAPRLEPDSAKNAFDALVAVLGKTTNVYVLPAAGAGLAALAPRLDPAFAKNAFDALVAVLGKTTDSSALGAASEGLAALAPRLEPAACRAAILQLLNAVRTKTEGSRFVKGAMPSLLRRIDSPGVIAEFLRDPACVGSTRDSVILRLEELAYPQPQQAGVVAGLGAVPFSALAVSVYLQSFENRARENRRFRTVSDAGRWLAEHHPEIDLDRPYHK